ncbi:developmentally-regulated GTP-binding protein 2 isoform X2 [Myotis yumanensis]|uniref:developmentally-regulated GTP-binding protein 2 isoform X2 n=1 Tax=Myotis yumanensis TaxID=159337 RepID=UPI0038D3857E
MGILEKISEIEKEIARTQKNKATEYHLGLLKAKLAKYRAQLLEPSKSASSKGEGFDVMKSGDARVALIGFPSVGKSTFLSLMTSTASEAASYEFTTLTCIPGVIEYKGANIQLLDLPGIIEGAAQGKGRGRQVIAVARTADVVIMMLDATKGEVQRSLLEKELESVGIRLNKHKPNIYFKPKKGGGISFNSTVTLTQCSEKLVQLILHEYKIFNAEVLFREDCSPDEFIDVIVGNRVYMPCLYVYNKIDQISMEEVDRLARKPNSVVIREAGLHRRHHPPERGLRGACVPPHPPVACQPVQVRAGVGYQHQVQPAAGGPDPHHGARRCHPDCQEVAWAGPATHLSPWGVGPNGTH